MFELRSYQKKFIDNIRQSFSDGNRRVCGVMPCGAGKTLAIAELIKRAAYEHARVVFMVHRRELIEQTSKTFSSLGIEHGIICPTFKPDYHLAVQIASVQTLANRLDTVVPPRFLIVDECHHIEAETYKRIVRRWHCLLLGITATPIRMGGKTLHDSFDDLVIGPTVKELIAQGYLSKFKYYAPSSTINFQKLRLNEFGDFRDDDMSRELDRQDIIGDVVKCYRAHANGRRTLVYCINVNHSKHTAKIFRAAGINACHIDGNTPSNERQEIIKKFRTGEITVLCNVNLFVEGFDVPDMDCVILTRPTKSFTLYYQQVMRPLRPAPNKTAIIIDHVENNTRFPMPDKPVDWTLEKNELQLEGIASFKKCPECGNNEISAGMRTCNAVIAERQSIKAITRTANILSIIYSPKEPIARSGCLALADYKTTIALEFFNNKSDIISDDQVKRRCVAVIDQEIYDWKQNLYRLQIKCLSSDVSIREANISRARSSSFDMPILCDANGRVLKYFLDQNGNLICGHLFNIRKTRIDEDGVIIKIYESDQSTNIYFDNITRQTSSNISKPALNRKSEPPKIKVKRKSKTVKNHQTEHKAPTAIVSPAILERCTIERVIRILKHSDISMCQIAEKVLACVKTYEGCRQIAAACGCSEEWAKARWNDIKSKPVPSHQTAQHKKSVQPPKPDYRWK